MPWPPLLKICLLSFLCLSLREGLATTALGDAYTLQALQPLGAKILGLDLRQRPSVEVLSRLERELAERGFLIFPEVGELSSSELAEISRYFGGQELHSRHSMHSEALNEDILRLSNREEHGIPLVGPQWHNDGSTERIVFSHVVFHAQRMPSQGGETEFSDLAKAFESLPQDLQEQWSQLASVNAYSGVVHPLVHRHPITNKHVLFLHLGQTGAIVRWPRSWTVEQAFRDSSTNLWESFDAMRPGLESLLWDRGYHVLNRSEMINLFHRYDDLLSCPQHRGSHKYRVGDLVVIDNLAAAHRAAPSAHDASNGLRILHRTTVKGTERLDAPLESGLPPFLYIFGENPFCSGGVWESSDYYGVGFRWNESVVLRN